MRSGWIVLPFCFRISNFNSQPHKEADERAKLFGNRPKHFNSQPHKEADLFLHTRIPLDNISTHSLTRRLTYLTLTGIHLLSISTHSLTRRLTSDVINNQIYEVISTHSLTRRLTVSTIIFPSDLRYFNSQPHKEADCNRGKLK